MDLKEVAENVPRWGADMCDQVCDKCKERLANAITNVPKTSRVRMALALPRVMGNLHKLVCKPCMVKIVRYVKSGQSNK